MNAAWQVQQDWDKSAAGGVAKTTNGKENKAKCTLKSIRVERSGVYLESVLYTYTHSLYIYKDKRASVGI